MEFVKTETKDGLIFQGLISEANKKTDVLVLHIHGMSGNFWENGFIKSMLSDLPNKGISFLTVETRGAELIRWFHTKDKETKRIGNSYEIFEDCILDIDAWVNFAKSKGYSKIYLQGHSLGCCKIAYFQKMKNNPLINGLIFISLPDMMGLLVEPKYKKEYESHLKEAKELISKGKGEKLLSKVQWDFAMQSANSYVNFSFENNNLAIFNYYNPERGFKTIESVTVPMLAFSGTKDDAFVTNQKDSLDLLKVKAKNCPRFEYQVFDGAEHQFDGFEKNITDSIIKFIKEKQT